jgi:hypothetical protein
LTTFGGCGKFCSLLAGEQFSFKRVNFKNWLPKKSRKKVLTSDFASVKVPTSLPGENLEGGL